MLPHTQQLNKETVEGRRRGQLWRSCRVQTVLTPSCEVCWGCPGPTLTRVTTVSHWCCQSVTSGHSSGHVFHVFMLWPPKYYIYIINQTFFIDIYILGYLSMNTCKLEAYTVVIFLKWVACLSQFILYIVQSNEALWMHKYVNKYSLHV